MQSTDIEIRDKRSQDWYWMNNLFIDSYGEIVGTHAVAVYAVLCRHSNNDTQQCFPSMDTIARKAGIKSRKTVSKAIDLLEFYNIIEVEKSSAADGKRLNNIYHLITPGKWKGGVKTVTQDNVIPVLQSAVENIAKIKSEELDRAMFPWLDMDMWKEWVLYRKEKKQPLKSTTIKYQIKLLEKYKEDHSEMMRASITNGWTGLFPLKKNRTPEWSKSLEPSKKDKYKHLA